MIDIKINKDYFEVKKIWHDNDDDFYTEMMTMLLVLSTMNAMKNERQCDLRLMNTFYTFKEDISNLENGLKNNRHPMNITIRETQKLVKQIRRDKRNEIKNINKKSMIVNKDLISSYEKEINFKNKELIELTKIKDKAYISLEDANKRLSKLEKSITELENRYNITLKDNITLAAEIATLSMERDKLIKSNAGYKGNMVKAQNQLKVLKGGKDGKCK